MRNWQVLRPRKQERDQLRGPVKEGSGPPSSGKTDAGRDAGHMALVAWWTHLGGVG